MKTKTYFSSIDSLRAKIVGYQTTAAKIRKRISKSFGEEKHSLNLYKKSCGQQARLHQVALGFLKGYKYEHIERGCKTTDSLKWPGNVVAIVTIMNQHNPCSKYMPGYREFDSFYVERLLKNEEPEHVFKCEVCSRNRLPLVKMDGFNRSTSPKSNICRKCASVKKTG